MTKPAIFLGLAVALLGCRSEPLPTFGAVPDFSLTTAGELDLRRTDLLGQPWIVDFVFTRCPGPCPMMSSQMKRLGPLLPDAVRRVSVTVDPAFDTPAVLRGYAASFEATEPAWTFATGPFEAVRALAIDGFHLGFSSEGSPEAPEITHSTRFALVDAAGQIRGYYDPFEPKAIPQLARDATRLAKAADDSR